MEFPVLGTIHNAEGKIVQEFRENDMVLHQVRGHQAWPGRLVNWRTEYPANKDVLASRPRHHKQAILVRFFGEDSYGWATPQDLFKLTKQDVETNAKSKKEEALRSAYEIAASDDWIENDLQDRQERLMLRIEAAKDRAANGIPDRKASPSEDEYTEGHTAKKRKVSSPTKEQKSVKIILSNSPKPKPRSSFTKPSAAVGLNTKAKALQLQQEEGIAMCSRWRHQLQKAFLSNRPLDEMQPERMDALFNEIEVFEHHFEWLVASKLPKIFKHISALKVDPPHEDTFHFKVRAKALVENWKILFFASSPEARRSSLPNGSDASPQLNTSIKGSANNTPNLTTNSRFPSPPFAIGPPFFGDDSLPHIPSDARLPNHQTHSSMSLPSKSNLTLHIRSESLPSNHQRTPLEKHTEQATSDSSAQSSAGLASTSTNSTTLPDEGRRASTGSSSYPSPALTNRATSVDESNSLADWLNKYNEDLAERVLPILRQAGLQSISDLYIFSPDSWNKFCNSRLSALINSEALEFCLTEAVEALLIERQKHRETSK